MVEAPPAAAAASASHWGALGLCPCACTSARTSARARARARARRASAALGLCPRVLGIGASKERVIVAAHALPAARRQQGVDALAQDVLLVLQNVHVEQHRDAVAGLARVGHQCVHVLVKLLAEGGQVRAARHLVLQVQVQLLQRLAADARAGRDDGAAAPVQHVELLADVVVAHDHRMHQSLVLCAHGGQPVQLGHASQLRVGRGAQAAVQVVAAAAQLLELVVPLGQRLDLAAARGARGDGRAQGLAARKGGLGLRVQTRHVAGPLQREQRRAAAAARQIAPLRKVLHHRARDGELGRQGRGVGDSAGLGEGVKVGQGGALLLLLLLLLLVGRAGRRGAHT